MLKDKVYTLIDSHKKEMFGMARDIWENPELSLEEEYAYKVQKDFLEKEGFKISLYDEVPTGFMAEFGEGEPVIGLLGEYDALRDLSQDSVPYKKTLEEGKPGHGCGHNLLGVACLSAALSIKELIERGELKGTVRYYGSPAEEILYGKVKMAYHGAFEGLDACLTWHPSPINMPWSGSLLSLFSLSFHFKGKSSHAGTAPHLGRSALDAVEIMNVGANYMREHIEDGNRVHYITTEAGVEPNTVPAKASVWYNVRAPKREIAMETVKWLREIAEGAAMITQTQLEEVKVISGSYEVLTNQTIISAISENMKALGGPTFSDEDREFAKKINESFDETQKRKGLESNFAPLSMMDDYLHEEYLESRDYGQSLKASTDVGDVSWITPLAMFGAATWPLGVAAHTWQAVAASGSNLGMEAMHYASKVLAATTIDLITDGNLLEKAKEEFKKETKGRPYINVFNEKL